MMAQEDQAAEEEDAYSLTSLYFFSESCAIRIVKAVSLMGNFQWLQNTAELNLH